MGWVFSVCVCVCWCVNISFEYGYRDKRDIAEIQLKKADLAKDRSYLVLYSQIL